jgi:hypothetical protein
LAVRARLMVLFSGMIDLLSCECRAGSMHAECHTRLDRERNRAEIETPNR